MRTAQIIAGICAIAAMLSVVWALTDLPGASIAACPAFILGIISAIIFAVVDGALNPPDSGG